MDKAHSYSSLATLANCAQKFYLSYELGLESPTESLPMKAGSALDAALNELYVGDYFHNPNGALHNRAIVRMREEWGEERFEFGGSKHGHLTFPFLEGVLTQYMGDRIQNKTMLEEGTVLPEFSGVKHEFDWHGERGVVKVRGIPDFVLRLNRKLFVVDLKATTQWINDWWMMQFRIGHQLRIYAAMVESLTGEHVAGGMINAVYMGKGALDDAKKWATRKSAQNTLHRIDFHRGQIEAAHEWISGLEVVEGACQTSGIWPKNERACNDYGGCEYIDICNAPNAAVAKAVIGSFKRRER